MLNVLLSLVSLKMADYTKLRYYSPTQNCDTDQNNEQNNQQDELA